VTLQEGIGAESSSQLRLEMLEKAVELWLTNPVFGCGFDGFSHLSGYGVYSHTTIGEVLCNGGLVGLGLAGVFYLLPAVHLVVMARRAQDAASARLALGLLSFWSVFALFSCFAVMLDSREYLAMYAGMCGYIQENRRTPPAQLLGLARFFQRRRPGLSSSVP